MFNAVQDKYAGSAELATEDQSMTLEELLEYLRSNEDFSLGPLDALRAQTEAIGDPSLPKPEHMAALEWLQSAYALWSEHFPLEVTIASELRRLLPGLAVAAVTEEDFFLVGSHPLHRVLDTLQASAVGWQPSLGRAAAALEQLLAEAVEAITDWLHNGGDLTASCEQIIARSEKDLDRARRMTQRLIDREIGQLRSASARWKSAEMINKVLAKHPSTAEIGEFLRGPWYDSAQLVLLKFGADSSEWAQMSAVTETLLSSLHVDESTGDEGRQRLFKLVTKIPKDLKRWLLSVHMDSEAVADAIGLIEATHLRLLRQQDIELHRIEPLPMEGMSGKRTVGADLATVEALENRQWFAISQNRGETQRVQLILKLKQEQILQFANKAGKKALELSFNEFCSLNNAGNVTPLHTGSSFSRCLAGAAGITSNAELEALLERELPEGARLAREAEQREERERQEEQARVQREERLAQERSERQQVQRKARREELALEQEELREALQDENEKRALEEALRAQREQEAALQAEVRYEAPAAEEVPCELEHIADELAASDEAEDGDGADVEAIRDFLEIGDVESVDIEAPQDDEDKALRLELELQEAQRIQREEREQRQRDEPDDDYAREHDEADRKRIEAYLRKKKERMESTSAGAPPAVAAAGEDEIHIAMGTWLGFHDGDSPLMAKLAVHDREQDSFIFVNREGVKVRSLNKAELFALIDADQIDILEPRGFTRSDSAG